MKKVAAALAVLAALVASGAAWAADIDVQRNQPALIDGVLYPLSGKPLVMPDMEAVLSAFPTPRSEVNAIANIGEHSPVHVVVLDMMLVANAVAIANARAAQHEDVARLQGAIVANAVFQTELERNDIRVATVLAAEITREGVIVLYVLA